MLPEHRGPRVSEVQLEARARGPEDRSGAEARARTPFQGTTAPHLAFGHPLPSGEGFRF